MRISSASSVPLVALARLPTTLPMSRLPGLLSPLPRPGIEIPPNCAADDVQNTANAAPIKRWEKYRMSASIRTRVVIVADRRRLRQIVELGRRQLGAFGECLRRIGVRAEFLRLL